MNHGAFFSLTGAFAFDPTPERAPHWAPLDQLVLLLFQLFASPARLLRAGFPHRRGLAFFLAIVREAESGARRALLEDAHELTRLLPPPKDHAKQQTGSREPPPLSNDCRAWPAGFALRALPRAGGGAHRGAHAPTKTERDWALMMQSWPPAPIDEDEQERARFDAALKRITLRGCALRWEALRRVIENPLPFARRLARRLVGANGARLADALTKNPLPQSSPDPRPPDPEAGPRVRTLCHDPRAGPGI